MLNVYLRTLRCHEETDEVGSDEPYVLVTAVDLRSPNPTACEVKRYGPWEDVDTGDQRNLPGASDSFWGIRGSVNRRVAYVSRNAGRAMGSL